ncbi:Endoglucanase [bioreactor metagenome]|uniref:Endoglucanase n=1 Tax=bioreactor metagenome TaxID=1076179 RepID=A0A645CED3_9ZZZZ
MAGTSTTAFEPDSAMTRAMFVSMLYRMAGSPALTGSPSDIFSDCGSETWYADAVLWAAQNHITKGVAASSFAPEEILTREQMAAMLYRYALHTGAPAEICAQTGIKLSFLDESSIDDWARPGVAYCTGAGILNGKSSAIFAPQDAATRAMGAAVIFRLAA